MNELLALSDKWVAGVSLKFQRSLFNKIDWNARLIGIKGSRGVGKTTMLLQWLNQQGKMAHNVAFWSLDQLYFTTNSLWDTATAFYKSGGTILVLDEVHKYPGWAREIKNLYDSYADFQIVFTGSSIIDISKQEADLSRRAIMYELPGLSYREFLEFDQNIVMAPKDLDTILFSSTSIRQLFPVDFKPLSHFKKYLEFGYYPFYKDDFTTYHQRLQQLVRAIVEYDLAELKGFDIRNAKKLLQLLYIIVQQVPFKPNVTQLAAKGNIHRNSLLNYLQYLDQARLIKLLYPSGISVAGLQKPEKIYLDNTNLLYAFEGITPEIGTVRETFFQNQVRVKYPISEPKKGDFLVDHKYTFEVGGKGKGWAQVSDIENTWVVKDDREYPVANELPLWLFGFLY